MFRIPTPFTDTALLLTPRGGTLPGFAQTVLLLLVCLVPVALVLWLYRYELRLISRSMALGLLTLRLLVLLLLLFVLCFQPILAHTTIEELPGRVLAAVDRSSSMDVADPHRPLLDKLRLARALNVAGDLATPAQLDTWIREHEAGATANDAERQRQVGERVDALTRTQVGQRILAKDGLGLLESIAARHKVELLGFAQEAWDLKPEDMETLGNPPTPKEGAQPNDPAALVRNTDMRLPLTRALERSGPDQGRILGVVLLTDGQHDWGPSPVKKAIELGEHKLPIYPVALGARQAPPDVALAAVKAPTAVFKDVDAPIEARFKISGLPAQNVVVELQRAGYPPMQEQIRHDGTDGYQTVRFLARLSQVGTQTLTVHARPTTGEIRTDNNSQPVVLNVADDKARVLLVDGEARWEYHYLANALLRDRTVLPQGVVFHQPRLGKIAEEELIKVGNPRLTLPPEADAFASYDCIILGDVTPDLLPPPERVRLEKFVADRGGTLVITGGKNAMPLAYLAGAVSAGENADPLVKLMPLEDARAVQPQAGFPVTLTAEGKLTSFLQLDAAPDKSEQRWVELPRHFWGVVGRAKPGATALAYVAGEDGGQNVESPEKERALLARQNYGFGRVLFVGLDSTWRWRYKVGDLYHHRFWGQVIRWAASDKPLIAGNDFVRFGTRQAAYRQGQEVDLVVRLGEELAPLRPSSLAGARILRQTAPGQAEEAVALVPLVRQEAQPRVLEGRVRDLPPGQYLVELAIPELADKLTDPVGSEEQPVKVRAPFTVTPPESVEMVELATNWPLLGELATKSGGQVFAPENAGQLIELLTKQSVTRAHRTENKLWQWWGTLALFLLLLTIEWVGRKWAGLP